MPVSIPQSIIDTGITLRHALPDDLDNVVLLLGHLGYPLGTDGVRETYLELLDDPRATLLVADRDGEMIGLMSLREYPALRLCGYFLSIEELVVDPRFRGLGIGAEFVRRAKEHAHELGAVRLEVHSSTKRDSLKRRFYEKNGLSRADSTLFRMDFGYQLISNRPKRKNLIRNPAMTAKSKES